MRRPTYHVFVTQESQPDLNREKNTYWTKVGVAFAHNGKPGLNIVLTPGIAVSGKLVLLEPKDDSDTPQTPQLD
ncbi:hypothetical protein DZA65_02801 [Dickeya dianthicola]|uniref:ATP/GTP-binding protein remnant n=2 Tax=Pectobacteriaceae TaxID=1903410 RepID=A0A0H3I2V6_PECPM|nr:MULTISPECIES: hypothetical protein [Pectobacteriaceae]EKN4148277.1 hypothetical protein [Yersinia enterocolitica]AFI89719.1 Putative ATP/GTP-binding protein remnant [Pectobacterium parmentieri]AYC19679.1 hypothetical protein DZA65_02801 [Dickeya dianthicola]ELI8335558.1 hypothetical protein [Yersinia enterocolitica]MBI0440014.1 hypothetical protein [Dickeya dianthicola]